MKLRLVLVTLCAILAVFLAQSIPAAEAAAPPLQLPWPTNHQHKIYGGNTYGCDTHTTLDETYSYNADYYAIDFQFGSIDGSPLDVSAAATGTVIVRANKQDGYGNKVILEDLAEGTRWRFKD
jgi:hypothetical protein